MRRLNAFALLLLAVAVAGCTSSDGGADPTAEARRGEYLLTAEPAGALGVVAARTQLGDPPAADHEHGHDHDHADHEHAEHADHEHEDHAHEHEDEEHAHDDHDHEHAHDDHNHDHVHNVPTEGMGQEMVVVGQIGGVPDPWDKEHAAFFIVDSAAANEDHEHDHEHGDHDHAHDHAGHSHGDHENCPFCERAKPGSKSLAIVQFVDAEGKVLAGDARKLFDLKDKQVVVVKGRGTYDALGNLVISANGLYVRP